MAVDNARRSGLASVAILAVVAVVVGTLLSGPAIAKKKKPANTGVSAYCTLLGSPMSSYAPCVQTGRSVFTADDPANGNYVGEYSSIAIGADGKPVIAYRDGSARAVKVAKCRDSECRIKPVATTVDDPTNGDMVGVEPAIAVGVDGRPVVSYYDSTNTTLKVAACRNPSCTGTSTITRIDLGLNDVGSWSAIAIGSDGDPVIAYYDQTAGALKVAKCVDRMCTGAATITTVDDPAVNNVGGTPSIAIGADGVPVISYLDGTAQALKVAKCANPACTGTATKTVVDDPVVEQVGSNTSIAVPSDGNPVIAYNDSTNKAIKVAKCVDPSCALTAVINVVEDNANDLGTDSISLALGATGVPVIAYGDLTALTTKLARCADAMCSKAAIVTVDDPATHDVGYSVSLAIGIDGRPVVSYLDGTAGSLQVARA